MDQHGVKNLRNLPVFFFKTTYPDNNGIAIIET